MKATLHKLLFILVLMPGSNLVGSHTDCKKGSGFTLKRMAIAAVIAVASLLDPAAAAGEFKIIAGRPCIYSHDEDFIRDGQPVKVNGKTAKVPVHFCQLPGGPLEIARGYPIDVLMNERESIKNTKKQNMNKERKRAKAHK